MAEFLPEHQDFFNELINDDESDEEFEGFLPSDIANDGSDRESDSDESEQAETGDIWQDGDRPRVTMPFTGRPGLRVDLPEGQSSPLDFFTLFVDDNDYETMAEETNRYADDFLQKNEATLKPTSRFRNWVKTTMAEMKIFIAMTIAMGIVVQLDLSEYWTTSTVNSTPFFPSCMSRDRFWLLMSFYHLANNALLVPRGNLGHDPLFKLGSLYKNIIARFGSVYMPNRHLSLDEGMVPWRGHLAFRVYNPDKPKKYGIKAYMICDGETGYCTKFKLYTGKSNTPVGQHGATYDLVMDMMRGYFGQGYILYMDNYYSSPKLYKDLFSLGCGATGTLRANRKGIPQKILNTKVSKGEQFTMNNGTLLITKYHDRKVVHLISTIEQAEMTPTGRNIPGTNTPIVVPSIVREYNRFMGGVDRSDQMVSYSTFNARTLKWWKRVTFHVISLAVLNSYLLYKTVTTGNPMLHRVFRKRLVADLISSVQGHVVPSKSVGRPSTSEDSVFRLMGQHFPVKITATGKKKNVTRACVVCSTAERQQLPVGEKRKRTGKESSYKCDKCDKALCVDPCFKLFHTQKDFIKAYNSLTEK